MEKVSPHDFLFSVPLYTKVSLADSVDLYNSLNFNGYGRYDRYEGYNPVTKKDSTFKGFTSLSDSNNWFTNGGVNSFSIMCLRDGTILSFYVFLDAEKKLIMKVGQYPSIADFHISEFKKYRKVISDDRLREMTKAIGLAANGVGIGSFVYLRRIFEYLIGEAQANAIKVGTIQADAFAKLRMDEKIEALSDYLPEFLVENKKIYSILSVGIHALSEDECLAHFDAVKVGIEMILDEKLEKALKNEKVESAKNKISQVHASLATKKVN